ncbi:MAG: hypothetical protein ACE5JN_02585 [Candidatus Methylomirabilia bacterium]
MIRFRHGESHGGTPPARGLRANSLPTLPVAFWKTAHLPKGHRESSALAGAELVSSSDALRERIEVEPALEALRDEELGHSRGRSRAPQLADALVAAGKVGILGLLLLLTYALAACVGLAARVTAMWHWW